MPLNAPYLQITRCDRVHVAQESLMAHRTARCYLVEPDHLRFTILCSLRNSASNHAQPMSESQNARRVFTSNVEFPERTIKTWYKNTQVHPQNVVYSNPLWG